jgi:hypothetical protein
MVVTIWFLLAHASRGARGGRFDFFLGAREKLIFIVSRDALKVYSYQLSRMQE